MYARDYRDILGGGALILIGGFAAFHALTALTLGTISHMGPGMFPAAVGIILAAFGAAILLPALFREGERLDVDIRSFAAISLSIFAFAVMIRPFGLIPSVIALTFIVSRADSKLSLLGTTILTTCLFVSATLIFQVGLRMPVAAINWPW